MLRTLGDTARLQNRNALTCSSLNDSRNDRWWDSNGKCALKLVGRHTPPVQAASPKPLFWTPRPAMPNFLSRLRYMLRAAPGRAGSATSSASSAAARVHSQRQKILCVSHDAGFFGAQILVLHIARHLKEQIGLEVTTVLLGGGPLRDEFAQLGAVLDFSSPSWREQASPGVIRKRRAVARVMPVDSATSLSVHFGA